MQYVFGDPKMCRNTEDKTSNSTLNVCFCKLDILKEALKQICAISCSHFETLNQWQNIPDFRHVLNALNGVKLAKKRAVDNFNFALARFLVVFAMYRHQVSRDMLARKIEFEMNKLTIILSYFD